MSRKLDFNFAESPSLTDIASGVSIACARASEGAVVDSYGYYRWVFDNMPRYKGADIFGNLWNESENPTTGGGNVSTSRVTITESQGTDGPGPTGVYHRMTQTSPETNPGYIGNTAAPIDIDTKTYYLGAYLKAGTVDWCRLQLGNHPINDAVRFDLTNGVAGTVGSNIIDYSIDAVPGYDGWYWCWVVSVPTSTPYALLYIHDADSPDVLMVGDGSEYIDVGGFHLEEVSGRWKSHNQVNYSEDFTNGYWTIGAAASAAKLTGQTDRNGGSTAMAITSTTETNAQYFVQHTVVMPRAGRICYSAYVRPGPESGGWCQLSAGGFLNTPSAYYDLSGDGALGNITGAAEDAGIQKVLAPDGTVWYRVWYFMDLPSVDLGGNPQIFAADSNGDRFYDTSGGVHIYIDDVQCEEARPGQTEPTAYIGNTALGPSYTFRRRDYIPTTSGVEVNTFSGQNEGILPEQQATNLVTYSTDFSNAAYIKANSTVTEGIRAPDGTTEGFVLNDDGLGGGPKEVRLDESVTGLTPGQQYCLSIRMRKDQLSWGQLRLVLTGTPSVTASMFVNLDDGTIGTNSGCDDKGVVDLGNGWYEMFVVATCPAVGGLNGSMYVNVCDADNDNLVDADGTSSIMIWHEQLESGNAPTSPIKTAGATGTRNRDSLTVLNNSIFDGWTEGTMFVDWNLPATQLLFDGFNTAARLDDSTNLIALGHNSTDDLYGTVANGGTISLPGTPEFTTLDERVRQVLCWKNGDHALFANGVEQATSATATAPTFTSSADLYVGANGTIYFTNNTIRRLTLWDDRVTDEDALALSSGGATPSMVGEDGLLIRRRKKQRDRWRRRYRRT